MAKIDLSKKDSDTQNPMLLSLQQPGQMFQFPTITSISVQEREAVFNVLEFVINHVKQQIGRAPPNVAHELEHDEYGNLLVRVSFSLAQLDQMHGDTFTWMTLKYETLVPLSFQTPSVHITMGHIHAGFQKFGKVRNLRPIISKDGCNYNGWRCLLTVRRGANIPKQITVDEKHYPGNGIVQLAVADDRAYCDKHYYMLPSFCGCPKSTNKTKDTAKTENAAETENTAVASE
ncbi:hypothetical protein FBU59_003741 [Linderina macrospora]|uniref:Uncharacterized protein n=1 Tax=Linderina macrospora TaxID=4868 RepID=A0ACC1J7N0_9FUNG|nr:hypothetical protein FBU59_003741 [Linderina macrospora]